jgi:predicted ribosomally synthesized peptide with SipW-like signal peptide
MKEKQRDRLAVVLCIVFALAVLAASFGVTYAYLADSEGRRNSFTVGETIIEVIEDYQPPEQLAPGVSFTKKPWVENTGNLPCYVRMRADFSDSQMQKLCEPLDIDTADWAYNDADGYYYYKHLLLPGKSTSALFTTVTVKQTITENGTERTLEAVDMQDFDILVYAEAKQHVDHEGDHPAEEYRTVWKTVWN